MSLSCSKILTEEEMAERLRISKSSLQRLRAEQKVPWHPLMGDPTYYEDEVVEAYLNDQLNRGRHDPNEKHKIRRAVRGKGKVSREDGVLESLYVKEGRLGMDHGD